MPRKADTRTEHVRVGQEYPLWPTTGNSDKNRLIVRIYVYQSIHIYIAL